MSLNDRSRNIITVLLAGAWINVSEFLRNEVLLKDYWTDHYNQLNLIFPSEPINIVVWLAWGFCLSIMIFLVSNRFNFLQTVLISWFFAFVMMWQVTWNLLVLPINILFYAIPLSLFEIAVASIIFNRFKKK